METMSNSSKEILITGSGFAGLVAGITLKQSNISVKIFEGHKKRVKAGNRITLFPNGMKVLRQVGVADEVINSGFVIEIGEMKDHFGKHLVNRSMGKQSIYGEPTVTTRRAKVHEILYNKAKQLGIEIVYDKKVVEAKENNSGVELVFEDGSKYFGSLLIGCDGINSFIRRNVLKDDFQPKYAGLMYYGGFVSDQGFIKKLNLKPKTHYITVGPTNFFSYCFVDNPEVNKFPSLLWNCYLRQTEIVSSSELYNFNHEDIINKVHKAHIGWHSPIEKLILNSNKVIQNSISEVTEINNWFKGRMIVIGDAAHAQNPLFGGQGAGTALEDAYMLAKILKKYGDNYKLAFSTLENLRKPRTTMIGEKSRKNSKRSTVKYNKFLLMLRNKTYSIMANIMSEKQQNPYLSYDVEEELNKIVND